MFMYLFSTRDNHSKNYVLLVYQETLCVVLYTIYFSSVMIPVKIKIIMK